MSTDPEFQWDVFLSHSKADKDVVRDIANRLKSDGVRVWFDDWEIQPGDSIPAKIEDGLEQSRVLVLCMSKAAFGSDWAQLESHTFRFKDPLNHNRRFIPLNLDDTPIKGSLAQYSTINLSTANFHAGYSILQKRLNIGLPASNNSRIELLVRCTREGGMSWTESPYGKSVPEKLAGYVFQNLGHLFSGRALKANDNVQRMISKPWTITVNGQERGTIRGRGDFIELRLGAGVHNLLIISGLDYVQHGQIQITVTKPGMIDLRCKAHFERSTVRYWIDVWREVAE